MEGDGSSQYLSRKGGRVSDALLSFGSFSQIHWKGLAQFLIHTSPLSTDGQSELWRFLGKRAHLRAAVTATSHRSQYCWGRQGTWCRDQPKEVSHASSCSSSLPLGYLTLHPTAWLYPHPPPLGHCSWDHPTLLLRGVTGAKQHLFGMAKGQVLVPRTFALTSNVSDPSTQKISLSHGKSFLQSSSLH